MTHPAADPLFVELQLALAGSYSLVRELGRGGMGIVFLAREVHLDRLVAIKLLPPERASDSDVRERFLREARLAAKLSHPHIIPIHAVAETGDFVYFVMSYIDGETLTERVRAHGPLSASDGARVLREVAWALAYAHGQGIVHRDVKPDNILLETASGRALVADFGIAHVAGDAAGELVAGTPEFMSPEQCLAQPLDARSDLYSLGATAFFMFTGRFPFEGASAMEIVAAHVTQPAPPVASLGHPVPRRIAALIDRCLAKEASQRPPDAQSVAEQLGVALAQRRDVPVALRAFVKRARLNGAGTVVMGAALLPASVGMSTLFGSSIGWLTFTAGALAAPFAYFVISARKLLRMGFDRDDLAPAFAAEIDRTREELGSAVVGRTKTEKVLRVVAKTGGVVTLAALVAANVRYAVPMPMGLFRALRPLGYAWFVFAPAGTVTLLATLGAAGEAARTRDVDGEFWAKVWTGRIGRAVFGVARRFVGRKQPVAPMTHRATELALGMAAAQLYEALPKATRDALADLPQVLQRLQGDAQTLRRHLDEVQEALNDAGDAAGSEVYGDLRSLRDTVHARLGEAVARLETIRLDLLRLHTGAVSVEGVTTNLLAASDVSADVARLISAQGEVARLLAAPRGTAATPA